MSVADLAHYKFLERLQGLDFVEAIYLYGSRARGDSDERSDIDLGVVCPKATQADWQRVLDIVEDADTLLAIDCVRFDAITDADFKNAIVRNHIVLFDRRSRGK